jgi:hypothetical protein
MLNADGAGFSLDKKLVLLRLLIPKSNRTMMSFLRSFLWLLFFVCPTLAFTQERDTLPAEKMITPIDTPLRITNINPYITLHVDSLLQYKLNINKPAEQYYWYLRNAPVGLKIQEQTGLLTFKAEKKYFLSGKLKYDIPYQVKLGVQHLDHPEEHIDTTITLLFFNTEIIASRIKPTVSNVVFLEESDTLSFQLQCEQGSYPITAIKFFASYPIKPLKQASNCDESFVWNPGYDFVKDNDSGKQRSVLLYFVGATQYQIKDTAIVRVVVRDALNYPVALREHQLLNKNLNNYILQLKYLFLQLDTRIKKNKTTRTTFDLTSATTAMTGAILATSSSESAKNMSKILPSVGVTLVPVKEAVAPAKVYDQNQAALVRTAIKRLDYVRNDQQLIGEKDPDILRKTQKLRDELKQTQVQLIDVPLELVSNLSEEDLNAYFNSPEVTKKYRVSKK